LTKTKIINITKITLKIFFVSNTFENIVINVACRRTRALIFVQFFSVLSKKKPLSEDEKVSKQNEKIRKKYRGKIWVKRMILHLGESLDEKEGNGERERE